MSTQTVCSVWGLSLLGRHRVFRCLLRDWCNTTWILQKGIYVRPENLLLWQVPLIWIPNHNDAFHKLPIRLSLSFLQTRLRFFVLADAICFLVFLCPLNSFLFLRISVLKCLETHGFWLRFSYHGFTICFPVLKYFPWLCFDFHYSQAGL